MGWQELTESGFNTLVLERGRGVMHIVDYSRMSKFSWQLPIANRLPPEELNFYTLQSRNGAHQSNKHLLVKDTENPYNEIKLFDWIRDYHAGGRSIM